MAAFSPRTQKYERVSNPVWWGNKSSEMSQFGWFSTVFFFTHILLLWLLQRWRRVQNLALLFGNVRSNDYTQLYLRQNLNEHYVKLSNSNSSSHLLLRLLFIGGQICVRFTRYCNGFDQLVARQQLSKHGLTHNNRGSCVFCRSDRRANRLAG
jgi:hypothetical protein